MPNIILTINIGPLVQFEIEGDTCTEITEALEGFGALNKVVDAMCSDLAERVYPEGAPQGGNFAGQSPEQSQGEAQS